MVDRPDSGSPARDDNSAFGSEADLDAALAQASDLAEALAGEVGSEPDPLAGTARRNPTEKHAPDLDAALSELESLVAEADRQVADVKEVCDDTRVVAAPPTDAAPDSSGGSGDAGYDVPDFMAEFMEPDASKEKTAGSRPTGAEPRPAVRSSADAPAAAAPTTGVITAAPTKSPPTAKPGVIGTGMLGVVGGEVNEPASAGLAGGAPASGAKSTATMARASAAWTSRLFSAIEGPSSKAAAGLVTVLDTLDRPVSRLGPMGRRVLGWVALATFATALIAYVFTLIRFGL